MRHRLVKPSRVTTRSIPFSFPNPTLAVPMLAPESQYSQHLRIYYPFAVSARSTESAPAPRTIIVTAIAIASK